MLLSFFLSNFHPLQIRLNVLLLTTAIHVSLGRISLTQTRVSLDSEPTWPVAGVASMELDSDVAGYWFDCAAAGEPATSTRLTWERVGGERNPFEVARLPSGSSRLIVGGALLLQENLGHYRCWHRDTGESSVLLLTSESPAIIADQETVAAVINQTVTLSVHISTFLPPETTLHITWSLPNGGDLCANDTSIEYQSTGSSLVLTNVTTDNAGEYVCSVHQSNSPTTRSASIHLRLFIPAVILKQPLPVAVVEGQNATLTCTATGSPTPIITWKRAGTPPEIIIPSHRTLFQNANISSNEERREIVSSRLVLVEARSEDTGVYYCVVTNTLYDMAHSVTSDEVNLSVNVEAVGPPVARVTYNSASSSTHSVVLFSGEQTKPIFRCSADGRPSPSISWDISHSHSTTPSSIHYTYELTRSELSLVWEEPVEPADSGLYQCVASNPWGESRASVHLTVIHKPVIDSITPGKGINLLPAKKNSETLFEVPENFIGTLLTCSGYGWPAPRVQWTPLDELALCGLTSETRTHSDGVVKAELILDTPFNRSCEVGVKCEVVLDSLVLGREVDNASYSVYLKAGSDTHQRPVTEFQLSLRPRGSLVCSLWTDKDTSRIKTDLGQALSRSVSTTRDTKHECINISSVTCDGDRVSVIGTLQDCSTTEPSETTLYSFLRWKNSGSLVSLNGTLCEVDPELPLCLTGSECGLLSQISEDTCNSFMGITVGLYVVGGAILLSAMVLICVILCKCHQRSCWNTDRNTSQDTKPNDYDM